MFSRSQHFVVAGGTFHNVTNYNTVQSVPSGMHLLASGKNIYLIPARFPLDSVGRHRPAAGNTTGKYDCRLPTSTASCETCVYRENRRSTVGRDGCHISRGRCSRGASIYIVLLAVFTHYVTLSGMAGGHGTLLTASVQIELGCSVLNLPFQPSKYRSTVLFRKFVNDACCDLQ
jgi:hypothetical protein